MTHEIQMPKSTKTNANEPGEYTCKNLGNILVIRRGISDLISILI